MYLFTTLKIRSLQGTFETPKVLRASVEISEGVIQCLAIVDSFVDEERMFSLLKLIYFQ